MTEPVAVKICGLTDAEAVQAAIDAGAAYIGLVCFPPSPRHVDVDTAASLAETARGRAKTVALTVNADDDLLAAISERVAPDFIQFHGSETPDDVARAKARHGIAIIKAVGIRTGEDIDVALAYRDVADLILLDAKAPRGADRPGGHGAMFNWSLLDRWPTDLPYMLAGGLAPENVADAIRETGTAMLDVSSGVESAPGVKDAARIRAFMTAVRSASEGVAA